MTTTPKTDALIAALRRRGVEVLTHEQWGSARRDLYRRRLATHPHGLLPANPVDTLWNHITVTNDDGPTTGNFALDLREVERIGFERFGSGVSYNIVIDPNAPRPRAAIGQFLEAKGTHTVNDKGTPGYSYNQNKVALAVAWLGVPGDKLNPHAVEALVQVNAALIEVKAMTDHYDNVPHSLVAAKDCPTNELRDRLPDIKHQALAALKPPAPAPLRYRVTGAQPTGKEYHGPGNPHSPAGLARYHETNSLRGVRKAKALGYARVDLDVMLTKDLVLICNHSFDAMGKEGFRAEGVPRLPVDQLTWDQVKRLRAPDGIRIQKLATMLAECERLGIWAALDLKGDAREGFRIQRAMGRIVRLANGSGAKVYLKCDPEKRGLRIALDKGRELGFWTRFNGSTTLRQPE